MGKEKIAIVTVRYGLDVQGGEETRARYFAEILNEKYETHVITTQARSFITWANEIKETEEIINGVTVKRFPTDHPQQPYGDYLNPDCIEYAKNSIERSEEFLEKFGPYSTKMFEYLKEHQDEYKYFIYMPYLYPTTYFGTKITDKQKNIIAPAAHPEELLKFIYVKHAFDNVSKIIWNAEEERKLVYKYYAKEYDEKVVGIPISPAEPSEDVIEKFHLDNPYLIYAGRIDTGKEADTLIDNFIILKDNNPELELDLILIGKAIINIPKRRDIRYLGFLSEEDKSGVIAGSKAFVLPSGLESFSIVILEAMALGVPVLCNGLADVVVGHCINSNAGLWYKNAWEFEVAVKYLIENPKIAHEMGKNGQKYAKENYTPEKVSKRLLDFLS